MAQKRRYLIAMAERVFDVDAAKDAFITWAIVKARRRRLLAEGFANEADEDTSLLTVVARVAFAKTCDTCF
jgi:hypothetical protein